MMAPAIGVGNLRITLVISAAVMLFSLPAISAGSGTRAASDTLSRPNTGGVLRPGARASIAQAGASSQRMLSLDVHQHQGAEAIDVSGSAPPNAPVTITLLATVSSDVPTIVVSRQDVVTDVNGRFGALIPIASAYERGTILRIVATSLPGVVPASAQLVINAPNAGVTVPLEQTPQPAR